MPAQKRRVHFEDFKKEKRARFRVMSMMGMQNACFLVIHEKLAIMLILSAYFAIMAHSFSGRHKCCYMVNVMKSKSCIAYLPTPNT